MGGLPRLNRPSQSNTAVRGQKSFFLYWPGFLHWLGKATLGRIVTCLGTKEKILANGARLVIEFAALDLFESARDTALTRRRCHLLEGPSTGNVLGRRILAGDGHVSAGFAFFLLFFRALLNPVTGNVAKFTDVAVWRS